MPTSTRELPSRRAPGRVLAGLLLAVTLGVALGAGGAAAADTHHAVTIINRCQEQIWIGEFGPTSLAPHDWALAPRCTDATASICPSGTCDGGSCSCQSDADCTFGAPAGTTTAKCDLNSNRCLTRMRIDVPPGWSGRFWPRTGCSGSDTDFVCETGQCGPPTGGNIDCTVQNASANLATLFELAAAGQGGADNFDVSLVSGYNVPVAVKVALPADAPRWTASTFYASGAQIIERVGKSVFNFTNGGQSGTSGSTRPAFPRKWTHSVADGGNVVWVNTGPACETSGCSRRGIREESCPSVLRVAPNGEYVACDVPANACTDPGSGCTAGLNYYQCQNNGGEQDLFGKVIGLQSPNAATFVCFSAKDCPNGTRCKLDPAFADQGFLLPAGSGVCTPVAQNGGCGTGDDGKACGAIHYPFVGYTCQTLSGVTTNAQVCVPPVASGMGSLWWNAANWTHQAPPTPTPTGTPSGTPTPVPTPQSCSNDGQCGATQKCLTEAIQGGLKQCPPGTGSCTCWYPKTCTAATCPGANQCLNVDGVPDGKMDGGNVVDCATETCYCGPQGIYSGTCGPTNPGWVQAAAAISESGATWPQGLKRACPIAYSYQYDDPSSNWSCTNPAQGLNGYRVVFCGSAGR